MTQAKLKVTLIAHTPNIEKVIATAGKLCYSHSTINELEEKLTEANIEKFINMIMGIGHESILEHCSFTFAVEGISRTLTHQLVRHRIASYSQQSQRYVKLAQFQYIIPKDIENNKDAREIFIKSMEQSQQTYDELVHILLMRYIDDYHIKNNSYLENGYLPSNQLNGEEDFQKSHKKEYSQLEKKAIENARYIFPNACETKIIITMNIRSLINFFQHRSCSRAQDEIRDLSNEMLRQCRTVSPLIFKKMGAHCIMLGYCPEGKMGCGLYPTLEELKNRK
ncbi:FAD-dependent thymidylate synthase [Clostridium tagluense]|uniref:Flavin-dependent thymidylate synthase n=1 Tax=Clostridium tagluense TaxID=360422 RepID=A0A401UQJ9_9CLOT|nr:FAD-dependent thymidylate synthase [Clostridium tagluense]GCD11768.1 flavin-dependent thymidylate synthase [Clostridium tagluense]